MPAISTVLDDRYRLDELIGRGGMADVYRARDLRLCRDVAVKVLREVEHERRFELETRTLAMLHHPNLVELFDAGSDSGDSYLVMELLGGASVDQLLRRGPLDPPQVAVIGQETAAALDFIHARDIVHRDVKPSNLMFDGEGAIRLADFGIVRLVGGPSITATHQTIGTMAYLAPEQLRGSEIGPPADVYSLGLVLLECLTGQRAFDGTPVEAGAARLARQPEVPPGLPAPWPALLQEMTAQHASARPTAADVRDRLGGPAPSEPPTTTAILPGAAIDAAPTVPATLAPVARRAPVGIIAAGANGDGGASKPAAARSRRIAVIVASAVLATTLAFGLWAVARQPSESPAITPIEPAASDAPTTTSVTETTSAPPTTPVPITSPPTVPAPLIEERNEPPGRGRDNGSGRGEGSGGEGDGDEDDD